jgi:hypothetical protein
VRLVLLLLCGVAGLAAQTFDVIHKKPHWPNGQGRIHISEEAITFEARKEKNSRSWSYTDIQHFDRVSKSEFVILSYEDQKWKLGRDREFRFVISSGELTDGLMDTISHRLGKPVTNRVVGEVAAQYELPVKHLHTFGGCEGRLLFTNDAVYYSTERAADAREWKLTRDVRAVSSVDPYLLEIRVFENNRREFSRTMVYRFALKQPLDAEFYRNLKLKLYGLERLGTKPSPQ